ncbi:MAG: ATP-binding protein [Polyangiaceae bacterium]
MNGACGCTAHHQTKVIVLTGGPGAGKTAVLELLRRRVCKHVVILPEAATIVYGGGFPRRENVVARCAAQRAIFHVQRELEVVGHANGAAIILCDRGTVDGLAYWPTDPTAALAELGTTIEEERARYDVVIHLRTPPANGGYDHTNPVRIESPAEAEAIDRRIASVWEGHPRRLFVENSSDFLVKAQHALELLTAELPSCCKSR